MSVRPNKHNSKSSSRPPESPKKNMFEEVGESTVINMLENTSHPDRSPPYSFWASYKDKNNNIHSYYTIVKRNAANKIENTVLTEAEFNTQLKEIAATKKEEYKNDKKLNPGNYVKSKPSDIIIDIRPDDRLGSFGSFSEEPYMLGGSKHRRTQRKQTHRKSKTMKMRMTNTKQQKMW